MIQISRDDAVAIREQRLDRTLYSVANDGTVSAPLFESIRYVCNYYEFLAAAVYHGDIDDALLYSSIGDIMRNSYRKFENIIDLATRRMSNGAPLPSSSYFYYWWLINVHWVARR